MKKFYKVSYKNWEGKWITDARKFGRGGDAAIIAKEYAKTKALNGQTHVSLHYYT